MTSDAGLALALSYAPADARPAVAALLALDRRLGAVLRGAREPMLAQMRLTWWFEALERLDREPPPAEPVLQAFGREVLPRGVTGARLAAMVDGWEALLADGPLDAEAFARDRGARLFEAMEQVCGAADAQAAAAGEGWALADLAANLSDPETAAKVKAMAAERLAGAFGPRWSRAGRGVGALALLARMELEKRDAPFRVGRLLWHRMTGR